MWQQMRQLLIKAKWKDIPLMSWSLAEAFKNNIYLDSLLLFDGLLKKKAKYVL